MQSFTHFFAGWIIFAHSVLGCCWHHQHAHATAPAVDQTALAPAVDQTEPAQVACSHHHHESTQAGTPADESDGPTHEHPAKPADACDEVDCVYVRESAQQLDCDSQLQVLATVADTLATEVRQLTVRQVQPPDPGVPRLRLHLFKGVLLI